MEVRCGGWWWLVEVTNCQVEQSGAGLDKEQQNQEAGRQTMPLLSSSSLLPVINQSTH